MSHSRQLLFHSCSITKIKFSALVGYKVSYRQTLICSRQPRSCRGVLDRTLCNIKFVSDYGSSVVFHDITGNIAESDVKHHNPYSVLVMI